MLKVLREERADDQCETTADINALRNKVPAMLITMMTIVIVVMMALHEMSNVCHRGRQQWPA